MNFFDKFASKTRNVVIFASIKLSLAGYLLYFYIQQDDMAKKIILLAGIFLLVMAIFPVVLIHYMLKQQAKKKLKADAEKGNDETENL